MVVCSMWTPPCLGLKRPFQQWHDDAALAGGVHSIEWSRRANRLCQGVSLRRAAHLNRWADAMRYEALETIQTQAMESGPGFRLSSLLHLCQTWKDWKRSEQVCRLHG